MLRGAVVVAAIGSVLLASPAADDGEVFRFRDPAIVEASALVDLGRTVVTANDSGNAPDLFSVDVRTGRTVGVTHLDVASVDIEALAPAGRGRVWVGDIGDNLHRRSSIAVYLAPVADRRIDVRPSSYRLGYPDGAHDAESLVAGRSGRLYVITKSITGGGVYRAPRRLDPDRVNPLRRVARVGDFATDAALLRDGKHVLVRGYGQASLYTFPGFRRLGRFPLPAQQQGEGISVGAGGRILLSSEGLHAPVLRVSLPGDLEAALAGSPSATSSPRATEQPTREHRSERGSPRWLPWGLGAVIVLGVLGAGLGTALRRRHR